MKTFILTFLLCFLFLQTSSQTETNQPKNTTDKIMVDPNDLDPATLAKVKAKQTEEELKAKINTYGNWVGIGKEVGVAVDEGLTAVTKHATAIADTRIGKVTMFIIAYKVIGKEIVQIICGVTLWFILTIIFIISFFKNCMSKTLKDITYHEDGKTIKTIKETLIRGDGESMLTHAGLMRSP
jgi:hypothetical protein